jgi:hypothetical protein
MGYWGFFASPLFFLSDFFLLLFFHRFLGIREEEEKERFRKI